jgi:hypothetical protein
MNFNLRRAFWLTAAIFSPLLLTLSYYGLKKMTSIYKTDQGNGVVLYADDYVKSGKWVFHCNKSRLISRQPLPAPIKDLEERGKLSIGNMYYLDAADEAQAKLAIRAITGIVDWYKKLRYRYSGLDEDSNITIHYFDLLGRHNGRPWALNVSQSLDNRNKSSFEITAESHDPDTYIDYTRMLQAAAKSCLAPQ